jgi:hypothetical protein
MNSRLAPLLGLSILIAAPGRSQDNMFEFAISNVVSPQQPSATIEAWFRWNPDFHAFAGAFFSVSASADAGGWSDPQELLNGPGTEDGEVSPDGDTVNGIISGQIHFPLSDIYADTSNPILLWRATWSTDDFSPREVAVASLTAKFSLYSEGGPIDPPYGSFAEGHAVILVGEDLCYADFTGDGLLDLFDFLAFLNAFNAGDPIAECDGDDSLDLFDFLCFVNRFNAGC